MYDFVYDCLLTFIHPHAAAGSLCVKRMNNAVYNA
jgi:hypothetical protein